MVQHYRVLHAPSSAGGHPQALSRALQRLGVDSYSLSVSQNYLGYSSDRVLHRHGQSFLLREFRRLEAILFLLPRFDIIHYNAGTTLASAYDFQFKWNQGLRGLLRLVYAAYLRLLQRVEMAYVKWLGKVVFITYQGDDARQGDYSLAHFAINIASQVPPGYYCKVSDAFKRKNIRYLCALARRVYSVNPDLLHVLPPHTFFTPYANVFMDEWIPAYTQAEDRPLRIVHAPSHRAVKGTELILAAVERLKAAGYEFELILVEGMSNVEARKLYASADILIDQLFAGWYGGLAVELMALGKPVMVYIREDDLGYIPAQMRAELPTLQVTPDGVEQVLCRVLEMPRAELVDLGRLSRAFVERWHDPLQIAARIKADYQAALAQSVRKVV